ncbi:hypothetical protein EWM64_g2629 [Hericium alpestre]|uniref:Uncharacterized protein n=1 Tax=Hericium alpestre TaxID=135208 RepID=A0A4Z0A4P3_9AGAM|nr:hypothetical protein EWM64_g2629 [Hericium alpestre]
MHSPVFASADDVPLALDEQFSSDTSPMVAIRMQADFGALLERALENEAAQMLADHVGGVDAAAVLQEFSSPGVFSTAAPPLRTPAHRAPSLLVNANPSTTTGTNAATTALGKKKKKGRKGKQGRLNRLKARMAQGHGIPQTIHVDHRASDFHVSQNAYTARPQKKIGKVPFSLEDLEKIGLKIVPWDGKTPTSALDIIETERGCFIGQPQAPDWKQVILDAAEAFEQVRVDSGFQPGAYHGFMQREVIGIFAYSTESQAKGATRPEPSIRSLGRSIKDTMSSPRSDPL